MANVSSSNGLEKRPKLRFPGFDESYRTTPLGEIASLVNAPSFREVRPDQPTAVFMEVKFRLFVPVKYTEQKQNSF